MSKSNRNFVAAEMGSRFKSKKFANDRSNRRAKDARNTKSFLYEIEIDNDCAPLCEDLEQGMQEYDRLDDLCIDSFGM